MKTFKLGRVARTAVFGAALGAGVLSAGCAADVAPAARKDDAAPARGGIEQVRRDVHVDLRAQPPGGSYQLEIAGRAYPLVGHDAFGVSFSNEAPQLYRVVRTEPNGVRATVASGLHLPRAGAVGAPLTVTSAETAVALAFQDPGLMTLDNDAAARVKAHIQQTPDFQRLVEAIDTFGPATSPDDQAKHHSGYQVTVVSKDSKGAPITVGSVDPNVKPHLGTHWVTAGSPEYYAEGFHDRYIVVDGERVKAPTPYDMAALVRAEARLAVRDDAALLGKMFTQQTDSTTRPLLLRGSVRDDGDLQVALDDTQWKGDRKIEIEKVEGRKVSFAVHNDGWRRLGVAVRFRDANGELIKKDRIASELPESEAFKYINDSLWYSTIMGIVDGRFTVLGVPLSSETVERYEVVLPKEAASFEVDVASAGFKNIDTPDYVSKSSNIHEPEPEIAVPGEVATELLDVALPILGLAAGAGPEHFAKNNPLVKALATVGVEVGTSLLLHAIATGGSGVNAFTRDYALELLTDVLTKAPTVATALLQWSLEVSAEKALEAPLEAVATVLEVIEAAGTAVGIAETVGTVILNAPIVYDRVAASETVDVQIHPKDAYFAPFASRVATYVYYGASTVPTVVRQAIDTSANGGNGPKTIDVVLPKQPIGGKVKVKVALESASGWVAGVGEITLDNQPGADNTLVVPVSVQANPVPIDATTRYRHDRVLAMNGAKHEWQKSASAPFEGPSLCNTGDTSRPWICGASSMTIANTGVLGYSWEASATTLATCDGKSNVETSIAQSINLDPNAGDGTPDARLRKSPCGSNAPVYLAFDPNGAATGGKHVLVQQVTETVKGKERPVYEVFPQDLGMPGPIAPDLATSLGHFRSKNLDAIVMNPTTGMLLGLDKKADAVEVLQIARTPQLFANAPTSNVVGGTGASEGRIHGATAVAFLPAGAGFMVLEARGAQRSGPSLLSGLGGGAPEREAKKNGAPGRVQAFTFDGAKVPMFDGKSTFALNEPQDPPKAVRPRGATREDDDVTYTDMKIDPTESYVYVSSYVGAGASPDDHRIDIYRIVDGGFVSRTTGVPAAKMAIDAWRDLYTLDYARISPALPEPAVSLWIAPPVEKP